MTPETPQARAPGAPGKRARAPGTPLCLPRGADAPPARCPGEGAWGSGKKGEGGWGSTLSSPGGRRPACPMPRRGRLGLRKEGRGRLGPPEGRWRAAGFRRPAVLPLLPFLWTIHPPSRPFQAAPFGAGRGRGTVGGPVRALADQAVPVSGERLALSQAAVNGGKQAIFRDGRASLPPRYWAASPLREREAKREEPPDVAHGPPPSPGSAPSSSSTSATARRRCGTTMEPPTTRATLKASKSSARVQPSSRQRITW
jgi:hypothetical protein